VSSAERNNCDVTAAPQAHVLISRPECPMPGPSRRLGGESPLLRKRPQRGGSAEAAASGALSRRGGPGTTKQMVKI
jgi:hypothetical protein